MNGDGTGELYRLLVCGIGMIHGIVFGCFGAFFWFRASSTVLVVPEETTF